MHYALMTRWLVCGKYSLLYPWHGASGTCIDSDCTVSERPACKADYCPRVFTAATTHQWTAAVSLYTDRCICDHSNPVTISTAIAKKLGGNHTCSGWQFPSSPQFSLSCYCLTAVVLFLHPFPSPLNPKASPMGQGRLRPLVKSWSTSEVTC